MGAKQQNELPTYLCQMSKQAFEENLTQYL